MPVIQSPMKTAPVASSGIAITDTAGGPGTIALSALNYSTAPADLGLVNPASGNTITGNDVNPVASGGVFADLIALRNALQSNDQAAITAAGGVGMGANSGVKVTHFSAT